MSGATSSLLSSSIPTGTYSANGTVGIVDTNYPIPAGAHFVATTGSDSNSGSQTSPWKTIGHAVAASSSGSTIVIHGGTYREGSINLGGKKLTLQPYPHEQVWLNGSLVVSNWVASGSVWVSSGWNYQFAVDTPSEAIDPNYPLAGHRDMVFIDGMPLTLVGSASQVGPGKFYVDYTHHQLYIGSNPNGHTVEATTQAIALNISYGADGTVVRGLGFEHYATSYDPTQQSGALWVNCNSVTVEDDTFAYNALAGMAAYNPNCTIEGNTFAFNGEKGLTANAINGSLIEGNAFAYNNQEHFADDWDAAGVKICNSSNVTVEGNLIDSNICNGLWFDLSCSNITIVGNTVLNNATAGITYEYVCSDAIIADNLVVGSGDAGVEVGGEASSVQVWNNTLDENYSNIVIADDDRSGSTRDVVVENNIFSDGTSSSPASVNVASHKSSPTSAATMQLTFNYNAYYESSSSHPSTLVSWSLGSSLAAYNNVNAFLSGAGQETHGFGIDNVATNPFFVNEASGDYQLKPGSPAIGAGVPLPADIAAAIGVAAGVPVNLGVLTW